MRRFYSLPRALGLASAAFLLLSTAVLPAEAQFRDELRDRAVAPDAAQNFFFRRGGAFPIEGVRVELPDGWTLDDVRLIRNGFERLAGRLEQADPTLPRYHFELPSAIPGEVDVVVRVHTQLQPGVEELTIVPITHAGAESGYRAVRRVHVEPPAPRDANRALAFHGPRREAVLLRGGQLPDLGSGSAFSVEFWLRTLALDRVVLSTWDGNERTPYPIELVVGRHGRLQFYRGRPGDHRVMSTARAVADGDWHHVAVVHDPAGGWTRFFLDGEAQDSLYAPNAAIIGMTPVVAIGGRPGADQADVSGRFEGEIDELRFWSVARSAVGLRQTMRRSLASTGPENAFFSFEGPIPQEYLARTANLRRERSTLSFAHPVQELRASTTDNRVSITWETADPETNLFLIERSSDGRSFEEAGRVGAAESIGDGSNGRRRYAFSEALIQERVVYYRIRQRLLDGTERTTASIKIGLGQPEEGETPMLVGNYPNPFKSQTNITYRIPQTMRVRVAVWDVSGQPVAQLVDEVQDEGFYEIPFRAEDLPSGTYFVRLQTPGVVGWHTLTLAK